MKPQTKLKKLVDESKESGIYTKLEKFLLSDAGRSLSYAERNRHFLTASKLKAFQRCPYCYKLKYIDLLPDPTEGDKDYFLIGQAFDDLVTDGEKAFDERYEVVSRRSKDAEKVQLTNSMNVQIEAMKKEFQANQLYNHNPRKRIFFWRVGDHLVKVELDDFEQVSDTHFIIRDVKTCANVKRIDPEMYIIQAPLYDLVVREHFGANFGAESLKVEVWYEFVDKNLPISRSQPYFYRPDTLRAARGEIFNLIDKITEAEMLGIYEEATDQYELFDCPYYGHNGHGRPTEPLIY